MKNQIIGTKLDVSRRFTQDGKSIPVTKIRVKSVGELKPGDLVKVTGWSKGKGFTGVVKRWRFAGGPRTHGQSDRERAPGSIGQHTTPGRVFKGKKMAGRVGGEKVTILGLTVMDVNEKEGTLLLMGIVPGQKNGLLMVRKYGQEKRFVPLLKIGEKEIKETEEEKAERLRREKEAEEKLKEVPKEEKPNA